MARKRTWQGRAKRRLMRQGDTRNRARARRQEITVATHNVRAMAVDGTHRVGRALDVLGVYNRLGCDVIDLQETRDTQPSPAVSAVARMVGRKGMVE